MADITIEIPDVVLQRVIDAFGAKYNFPPTRTAFVAVLTQLIEDIVIGYEAELDGRAAAESARERAKNEVVIREKP